MMVIYFTLAICYMIECQTHDSAFKGSMLFTVLFLESIVDMVWYSKSKKAYTELCQCINGITDLVLQKLEEM